MPLTNYDNRKCSKAEQGTFWRVATQQNLASSVLKLAKNPVDIN
jgi:hypothetical protein